MTTLSRIFRRRSQSSLWWALLGILAVVLALWPRRSLAAGCSPMDVAACTDVLEYSFWNGVAGVGWTINRTLLQLAYQLDQFRWWMVDVAFTTAYQLLVQLVDPLFIPVATVALILGCLLFMLVPLTGRLNVVSIRHVLIWIVLTPVLLTVGGQLVSQAEQVRAEVSTTLFTEASAGAPGAIFGVSASDMGPPTALYPANPCGGATLARRGPAGAMHMDDLAANYFGANAQDVWCPEMVGPSRDLPDGFFAEPLSYATTEYVAEMLTPDARRAAVEGIQRGVTRLYLGILPSMLAVVESLVHLTFSLSLVVLWLGLPLGLVFVFFQQTASGVTSLFRRAVGVLQVSWSCSFLMGLVFAALLSAAQMGNAVAYTGFSIGALLLMLYLAVIAFGTLRGCISTLSSTVQAATGLSVNTAIETTASAAALTTGAALVGVPAAAALGKAYLGTTVAGATGLARTGSVAYGTAAMAGRFSPVMAVGEVAAAMGWLDDEGAVYSGLRMGDRSTHSLRSMRLQLEQDSARLTHHQSAPAPRSSPPPAGGPVETLEQRRERIFDGVNEGAQRTLLSIERAGAIQEEPARRSLAMRLNDRREIMYAERLHPHQLAEVQAVTVPQAEANIPALLLASKSVQVNPKEGTVSSWTPPALGPAGSTETQASGQASPAGAGTPVASAATLGAALGASPQANAVARSAALDGVSQQLAAIAGQQAALSGQIAGLAGQGASSRAPADGPLAQKRELDDIEGAIEHSRQAGKAEQDDIERELIVSQRQGQSVATPLATGQASLPDMVMPLDTDGLRAQVRADRQRLVEQLDLQIAAAQRELAEAGAEVAGGSSEAQTAAAQRLARLGRVRARAQARASGVPSSSGAADQGEADRQG